MVFQKGNTLFKGKHHSVESKRKLSEAHKGKPSWNKGLKGWLSKEHLTKLSIIHLGNKLWAGHTHTEETKKKMSLAKKDYIPWIKGKHLSKEHVLSMTGENSVLWKGGPRLTRARSKYLRKRRGFVLVTLNNPFTEPIDYHHIHPDLPYVIPCPRRIHRMFTGSKRVHFDNVNAMLGIKLEVGLLH